MCLAASKLLNAFLLNKELLIILNIVNTKISFVIADRPPLPFRQAREKIDIIERERKRETHTRVERERERDAEKERGRLERERERETHRERERDTHARIERETHTHA